MRWPTYGKRFLQGSRSCGWTVVMAMENGRGASGVMFDLDAPLVSLPRVQRAHAWTLSPINVVVCQFATRTVDRKVAQVEQWIVWRDAEWARSNSSTRHAAFDVPTTFARRFRVMIYTNDYRPAHVHVWE